MYFTIKALSKVICLLPAALRSLAASAIGRICWLAVPGRRKQMAISNVIQSGLAADEHAAAAIVQESVYRFGPMMTEVLCFPKLTRDKVKSMVTVEGAEHLEAALAHGKGAVLATAHSGNWELLGAALAMQDFPLVAVVQKQTSAGADQFINEYRTLAGMHVTYKSSALEMARLLAEGKIIGLLMDQDAHDVGLPIPFFGRLASTPQGPAVLARMKGAPIVPAFITRKPDGTHAIIIHPPLWTAKSSNREQDLLAVTTKLNAIIESHIRAYPSEWFWLHNRWKTKYQQM